MDFIGIEEEVLKFWEKKKIRQKVLKKKGKKKFYYLDGPPYPTGQIHLGTSWGKYLRDLVMRYKRMNGYSVWSKPGFDMHGLPIEVKVEKKLNIKNKKEIEKYGVKKFVNECKNFADENARNMINDFKRLGVWLDWENPYLTYNEDYISGIWYAIKKADEKNLLYKGKKVLPWCPRCETALAKHELEYKTKVDTSLYLKFETEDGRYLIVWTTTPWTVPYNLAVMVNPKLDYVEKEVNGEIWILGKEREKIFDGKITKEFKGNKLEGLKYKFPFDIKESKKIKAKWKHKVILSEYVEEKTGTGLVHCAPGCGPEDNEIGNRYDLPQFNTVSENGTIEGEMGIFTGLKTNDKGIIELLKPIIVKEEKFEHEYPHCWRCKTPIIFRSTEQWFIRITEIKQKLLEDLNTTNWIPSWAGENWFKSWIENIQDWDISRQRYWGTPIPIWVCKKCGEKIVIGSVSELKKLSKKRKVDIHKPGIDEIKIKCPKCGGEMERVNDVLDVWIDSGNAAWASLGFPENEKLFKELWPVDFILEGKDQIRGWFYSLAALGEIAFDRIPYENVYMTGFINDALGRKFSKSLGNFVTPKEVIDKYGSDVLRFYQISGANPGLDLNYNQNDVKTKFKSLNILWNVFKYIKENCELEKVKFDKFSSDKIEDVWIYSRINTITEEITEDLENYRLNEVPKKLESFFVDDLSRWYLKIIKDRITIGTRDDKVKSLNTLLYVFEKLLRLLAPVIPILSEKMYQDSKKLLKKKEDSVHLLDWPKVDEINKELEEKMKRTKEIVETILSLRNSEKIGLRWPIKEVIINGEEGIDEIIKNMTNVKEIEYGKPEFVEYKIKINYNSLKEKFDKKEIPVVVRRIIELSPIAVKKKFEKNENYSLLMNSKTIELSKDDIEIIENLPENWISTNDVYLNKELTKELIQEGMAREVIRRIQDIRKEMGLKRNQRVSISIDCPIDISKFEELISKKTNSEIELTKMVVGNKKEFKIKGYTIKIGISK